jgi:molecular chaperone DnaK
VALPIVNKVRDTLAKVLTDTKLEPKDIDKIILIGGMTRMPLVRKVVEDFMGKPAERGVDPMECVAVGAAIQGAVLAGEVKDIVLLDVTPLSLGVETLGGIATRILEKNTTIPTRRSQIFSTASDFQTTVTIHVIQGERPMAADNISLGMFNLTGIPPAPRGVPQIEVTFDIDANGILNVSAKDLATGKESKITITASNKLSKEEKERLIKEAEQYAEQDRKKREEAELLNNADAMLYTAEKTKKDLEQKLTPDQKDKIDKAAGQLRQSVGAKDLEKIKKDLEDLAKVLQDIGTAVYQQAAGQPKQEGPSQQPSGDKVVDANYKVEDEKK